MSPDLPPPFDPPDELAELCEELRAENALLRRVVEEQRREIERLGRPAAHEGRDPTRYEPAGRRRR